jgi:hypothetical protein
MFEVLQKNIHDIHLTFSPQFELVKTSLNSFKSWKGYPATNAHCEKFIIIVRDRERVGLSERDVEKGKCSGRKFRFCH